MVALWRDETGDIKKKTCFYLMGHIKQDWFASLSNVESFIVYLKEGVLPNLKVDKMFVLK